MLLFMISLQFIICSFLLPKQIKLGQKLFMFLNIFNLLILYKLGSILYFSHLKNIDHMTFIINSLYIRRMGTDCTKISPKTNSSKAIGVSGVLQNQRKRFSEALHLEMNIENLEVLNFSQIVKSIKFQIEGYFVAEFKTTDIIIQEKSIKWNNSRKGVFQMDGYDIQSKKMRIFIFNHKDQIISKLSFQLYHILTGPYHQDHLLKQMKARICFDIKVTQKMDVNLSIQSVSLNLFDQQSENLDLYGFSLSLNTSDNEIIHENEQKIFFNDLHQKKLSLNIDILSHHLQQSNIILTFWKKQYIQAMTGFFEILFYSELYIPFRKIYTQMFKSITKHSKQYEERSVQFTEPLLVNGKNVAKTNFKITLMNSKLYVEQMECLIFSQKGIGTVSPGKILNIQNAKFQVHNLKDQLLKLKKLENYSNKQKHAVKKILAEIFEMTKSQSQISYSSQEQLCDLQSVLIDILVKISTILRQGEDVVNENLWRIINVIIHRQELSIRYLNFIQQKKQEISSKFYCFICLLLEKIVQSTTIGVTYHELLCIKKFIAYSYFRFPWLQKILIKNLRKASDPLINQQKLIEIGASKACKSPAKSAVYDWQNSFFVYCQNSNQFKIALQNLNQLTYQVPNWGKILFNREDDELFYGLMIQIWNQAESMLHYQGYIKWQYFPYYGEMLGIFLGEMNNNKIQDYSQHFKLCSLKILLNGKLLNSFMMLLFPKTCLYETYCVMKCLDFIQSYFQMFTKLKKKIPSDFNYNYFYSGIRSILDSDHSYLLVKTLTIIYKHYDLFSSEFKMVINNYIVGKGFFPLFMHWCGYVRTVFHILLHYKVKTFFNEDNPESGKKNELYSIENTQLNCKLEQLLKKIQKSISKQKEKDKKKQGSEYFMKMKNKLLNKKKKQSLIQKQTQNQLQQTYNWKRKSSMVNDLTQSHHRYRKWSMSESESMEQIPEQLKKYVSISLNEFKNIVNEQNPTKKMNTIEKLFSEGRSTIDQ